MAKSEPKREHFFAVMGASGSPDASGLGFRYDEDDRWPYPNPTGLEGVMEGFCPPHYPDMRSAVEAACEREFGPGGPFNADTPGPWKNAQRIRSAASVHNERFKECVALQAQYIKTSILHYIAPPNRLSD